MNILVVSAYYRPGYIYGGPVKSIHKRTLALSRLGHRLTTYTTDANGAGDLMVPRGQVMIVDDLPVIYYPRWWFGKARKPSNLFFSPALGRQLRRLQPGDFDLILIHAAWGDPGRMAAAAAKRTSTPYIYYTHGCFEPWALQHKQWKKRLYWELIEKGILEGAAGIVVCNEAETQELRALGINTPIQRIPWGVKLPEPGQIPPRNKLEACFPELKDHPYALFLSRLHPKKGLDLLIPAFASLAHTFPDWLLVLAGPNEGGYRAALEKIVQEKGLGDRVIFTGMVTGEAKASLLTHAGLFVLPSYSEGFPVAVAEAMGYGLPLVITETCYLPEVEEGGAGLVVRPEIASLTEALQVMLRDQNWRESCAHRSWELAQTGFSWEAVAQKSLAFYREAMQCRSSI